MKKTNSKLTTEQIANLKRIGQNLASLWGGSCLGYEIDEENEVVNFHCIEDGDEFVSDVKFSELKEWE